MSEEDRKRLWQMAAELASLAVIVTLSDPDATRTATLWWWRSIAEAAGSIAEKAGRLRIHAYRRYYEETGQ